LFSCRKNHPIVIFQKKSHLCHPERSERSYCYPESREGSHGILRAKALRMTSYGVILSVSEGSQEILRAKAPSLSDWDS